MDFQVYFKGAVKDLNQELKELLSKFLIDTKKTNPKLLPFAMELINSCKGGKRIRGVLVKLGYELNGGKRKEILKISTAFEILHSALLIHDDIMDQSPLRRGQPSLYQVFGGKHYGISQAINLGDIALYLPIKIISDSNFSDKAKIKAISNLTQTIINTGWGQVMDLVGKDREFINLYKTAKYTVVAPLQVGAILAGASDKMLEVLGRFGEKLGIAFQIQDDILDGDVGSVDKMHSLALKYVFEAKKMIPKITKDPKMRKLLEEMAEFLVQRTR